MEIGIILLPEQIFQEHTLHQVKQFDSPYSNIFHLSLFQMDVADDQLNVCMDRLAQCTFQKLTFKVNFVQSKGQNYALSLQETTDSPQFQIYMQTVINDFATLRSHRLLQQIDLANLSDLERKRVEQYGIYWNLPPKQSQPYMTLLYSFKQPVDMSKLNQCFQGSTFSVPRLPSRKSVFTAMWLKF